MPVDVSVVPDARAQAQHLEEAALCILASLGRSGDELAVSIVDDAEIRMLNRRYRGRDVSTDVLAFPQLDSDEAGSARPAILGDVVISFETAQRQARAGGWTGEEELNRLLVHGLLHLLGYDHEAGPEEAARMQREEQRVSSVLREAGHPCAGDGAA